MLESILEEVRTSSNVLESTNKKLSKSLEILIEVAKKYVPPEILDPILREIGRL